MATVKNLNRSDINLENRNDDKANEDRQQAEMQNIGEFAFDHIIAETSGS